MSVTPQARPLARIRSKQMIDLLASGKRIDGRGLSSYRDLKTEVGIISKAEGSASVSLGNTKVMVGVKVEVGEPYPDTPNSGVLTVNSEFVPLAHEIFEPGPPDENSIELARVVDRGIRESKSVDLEKLVLIPGKKVYVIFVDVYILNHDGNLTDASGFAALAALKNSKVPNYNVTERGEVVRGDGFKPLPMRDYPIPVTIAKVNNSLLVDPNLEEETMSDVRLTITSTVDGRICAIQKSGTGGFTTREILDMGMLAEEKSNEIRKKLLEAL
ncbi:MAG: exosome complex protein Rrp42 [Candidatus Bathyarchaeia archaeon]